MKPKILLLLLLWQSWGAFLSVRSAANDQSLCPGTTNIYPVVLRRAFPEDDPAVVPVRGSDGLWHVAYEMEVANLHPSETIVAFNKLQVLDASQVSPDELQSPQDEATVGVVWEAQKSELTSGIGIITNMTKSDVASTSLAPGQVNRIWMDATFQVDNPAEIPSILAHRLVFEFQSSPDANETQSLATACGEPLIRTNNIPDEMLQAITLQHPPLLGQGYVAADACCDSAWHRRTILNVNGQLKLSQRFATDWERFIQTPEGDHILFRSINSSFTKEEYNVWGDDIYAVANGTVIAADNHHEDIPIGAFPDGLTLEDSDGNHVILDIGGGVYVLYAHMQQGSVRVEVGDQVEAGQVLGVVGNTGNTAAPHLHFHVMDDPSPFGSRGLPYIFEDFNVLGRVTSIEDYNTASLNPDKRVPLNITADTDSRDVVGPRSNSYPLNLVVVEMVDFQKTQGPTQDGNGETAIEVAEDYNSSAAICVPLSSSVRVAAVFSTIVVSAALFVG